MMKSAKSTLFAASFIPPEPSDLICVDIDGVITGYNKSLVPIESTISIDLSKLTTATSISTSAFYDFDQLTALLISSNISSIGVDCVNSNCKVILNDVSCLFESNNTYQNEICAIYSDLYSASNVPLISIDSIDSVYLEKSYIFSNTLSCNAINNLYVFSKSLNNNAFKTVQNIDNCILNAKDDDRLSCGSNLFNYTLCSETGDSWIQPNVNQLYLNGKSFYIEENAFNGIGSKYLSINMSDDENIICANAFASADINILIISGDNLSPKLADDAFKYLYTFKIDFLNYGTFSELSSNVLSGNGKKNRLNIEPLTQIATSSDVTWYVNKTGNGYLSIPTYFYIEDDVLISCTNEISSYDSIAIPNIVTAIAHDALNIPNNRPLEKVEDFRTALNKIFVPNTVKRINYNAFAGNIDLETIMFEPGMTFEYIGTNIVSGCNSLTGITWQSKW